MRVYAPDSTFSLPLLPAMMDSDADLLLNARKGSVRWRTSARVSTHFISAQPILSASLVQGERRLALKTAYNGHVYVPPIHDQTWSNEALVELTLATN